MSAAPEPLLAARALVAGYAPDVDVVRGCDLELRSGDLIGIIGPNAAGKSTLLKALFGLIAIRSGSVRFRGADIVAAAPHERVGLGLGYVPQTRNVFPGLSVGDNLRMGTYLAPRRFDERFEVVGELFPGLADRRGDRAGLLSGGQQRMLALARALMAEPAVLLLDEPTSGLSPAAQDDVFGHIETLHAAGVAVAMVEHNVRRCLALCNRTYLLEQGVITYEATSQELRHDPRVIEIYLGDLGSSDPPVSRW